MSRVIGLQIDLEGRSSDLRKIEQLAEQVDRLGKSANEVQALNKRIKELEEQIKRTGRATRENDLPGGKRDRENVQTLAQLRNEMKRLAGEGKSYDELARRAGELKEQQMLVNREINRQRQLFIANSENVGYYRRLNAQLVIAKDNFRDLSKEQQNSEVGRKLIRDIQRLDTELKRQDAQIGQYFRNVGNYYNSAVSSLRRVAFEFGAVLGLAGGFQEIVQSNIELSDAISDVQKTTGLAVEEARELADRFREIDTRTTLEDLLAIAEGAGRLGLGTEGVDGLEAFAIALDKVNVALGDVLEGDPDQIATDLAKISSTFGLDEIFGVAGGIERVGASLNLLGASTKANENFILQATKRLQGVAATANLTAPEILGLTATLDELALTNEASTSAISKFIVEIAQAPDKFAALAETVGVSQERFQELLETNPNEAILTVLEAAQSSETGLAALNDTLEVLGITGVRSIQTITALSQNVDKLRQNQSLANEEFQKTTEEFQAQNSLYDEFQTKNENLAASVDKLKNTLINLVTQSGVQDFLQDVIEGITRLVLNIASLPKFLKENRVQIGLLIVALISFNAQLIAVRLNAIRAALSQVTLTNAIKAVRIAQLALNNAFRANPVGLVITAVSLLAAGFVTLYQRSETVRDGVQSLWNWVRNLYNSFIELYDQNLLVRTLFFLTVEPLRLLIGLFTDFDGTVNSFKDRFKLTALQVIEFIKRMGLRLQGLALIIKKTFTFSGENRQAIQKQLAQIEADIIASQDKVEQEQIEYNKREQERRVDRIKKDAEANQAEVQQKKEAAEEIDETDEELTKQEIERRKRLREQLKAERQKQLEEELKDRIAAAKKIADLETELIENRFDRREAEARLATGEEIAGLVGDPEQIERQTELIRERLRRQLQVINEERADAQQDALELIRQFNDELITLQVQAGVSEAEAGLAGVERLFEIDTQRLEGDYQRARATIERQFASNEITISEYQERLRDMETDFQEQRLALLAERGAERLTLQAALDQQRIEQLEANLALELEAIDRARQERNDKLAERLESGDIDENEFFAATQDSDELSEEQRLEREREFERRRLEIKQEFAQESLEFQEEIADREVAILERKNKQAIELEERRRAITLDFAEELSERITSLVTGQIEDFEEFSKQLLLLTLDVIEKTLLLYAAQATGREIATKGFAGIATGAILSGIIKATFAGIKGLVQRFDEGGDIGGAPTFEGSAVPDGGGMVNTGNLHAQQGIKGVFAGQPIEIERGEFVMRNGPVTHIINRKSAARFADVLNRAQSSFSPDRFNSNRARIARAINVTRLQGGGELSAGIITPPLIPPVSTTAVRSAATSATVSSAADTAANSMMLLELIKAVNKRIDRIEVVNDPAQTVRQGNTQIEVQNRNNP